MHVGLSRYPGKYVYPDARLLVKRCSYCTVQYSYREGLPDPSLKPAVILKHVDGTWEILNGDMIRSNHTKALIIWQFHSPLTVTAAENILLITNHVPYLT